LELTLTDLSIKDVPEEQVAALRERAKRNHRSLQGELRAVLDDATASVTRRTLTIEELSKYARRSGLRTPSESVQMIREDRDR
jgi:plasmid stability protein